MAYKREERVRVSMAYDWFNALIQSLFETQKRLEDLAKTHPGKGWERELEKNKKLIDKFTRYGQYFDTENGTAWMEAGLFRNEAEDLIWQLLLDVTWNIDDPDKMSHYENFKKENEELKNH